MLLRRILLGLATGYIFYYYGELVFWATPEREGMTAIEMVPTWLIYSLFAYVFLCVVSVFKARSAWAVFLAGAVFGWYAEGIFVQTMYGSPTNPFPLSISFTGLAWHALIDVMVGWYLTRKVLGGGSAIKLILLAGFIGLFYGLWAIWWWNEPPDALRILLEGGQESIIGSHFALFSSLTTFLLILAYWLYQRLMPFEFRPGRGELWILSGASLLYFAFVTVPARLEALWVLPPLLGVTFWALSRNRAVEREPDAISAFNQAVKPFMYLMLLLIPLVAIGIYLIGLAADLRFETNVVFYILFTPLGALMWIASLVMIFHKKTIATPKEQSVWTSE